MGIAELLFSVQERKDLITADWQIRARGDALNAAAVALAIEQVQDEPQGTLTARQAANVTDILVAAHWIYVGGRPEVPVAVAAPVADGDPVEELLGVIAKARQRVQDAKQKGEACPICGLVHRRNAEKVPSLNELRFRRDRLMNQGLSRDEAERAVEEELGLTRGDDAVDALRTALQYGKVEKMTLGKAINEDKGQVADPTEEQVGEDDDDPSELPG